VADLRLRVSHSMASEDVEESGPKAGSCIVGGVKSPGHRGLANEGFG
jgi:hypothetical protein